MSFFLLYGIGRELLTPRGHLPARRRKDQQRYTTFRTKELILEIYDAMAEATRTGEPYQTILDPPPGKGPRHG